MDNLTKSVVDHCVRHYFQKCSGCKIGKTVCKEYLGANPKDKAKVGEKINKIIGG